MVVKENPDRKKNIRPLKFNWNTIETPETMGNKVNHIHEVNFINIFHTPRDQGN